LCRHYDVAIFDRADAQRLGIQIMESSPDIAAQDRKLRALARAVGCGRAAVAHPS
jgi:hypothetical protein